MAIKRIVFIRPGETDWNKLHRQQGWAAVPLNEHGKAQAQRLANFIRNMGIGALYSSDLRRAKQTAEILAEKLGFQPIYDARFRERHIGEWQGLTLAEIRDWYPEDYERLLKNIEGYQIPGGESRRQVTARVLAALEDVKARGGAENIAIVTHTTALRALLGALISGIDAYNLPLSNMSVTTIIRENDDQWRIVQPNDVSHLEGMSSEYVEEPEENK